MNTFTKAQRKSIYLQAIENIKKGIGNEFLCGQLQELGLLEYMRYVIEAFPEFGLFKPTPSEASEYCCGILWFNHRGSEVDLEYSQIERLICLELCLYLLEDSEN